MKERNNANNLFDIQNIKLNHNLPINEKLEEYMQTVGNPYNFKSGNVEVNIIYSDTSTKTISNLMKDYFVRNK